MKFSQMAIMSKIAFPDSIIDKIREYTNKLLLYPKKEELTDVDCILVTWKDKVDANFLSYCLKLKFICLCSTNSDNIDKDAMQKKGIKMSNVTDYGDTGVAE
ncbi:MAG: hypothetical protein ABIJ34_02465 [archaeon]